MKHPIRAAIAIIILVATVASVGLADEAEARDLVRAAEGHLQQHNYSAAIAELKSAIEQNPGWFVPYSRLAVAYQAVGMNGQALVQYRHLQHDADDLDRNIGGPGATQSRRKLITQCEAHMMLLLNHARRQNGKTMLYSHPKIALVARDHSREMRDRRYFGHTSPLQKNRTLVDRFKRKFGFQPKCLAENLARRWLSGGGVSLSLKNIADSHVDLLKSAGHRRNILRSGISHFGIGIAINNNGDYWVTQVFADLRDHPEH